MASKAFMEAKSFLMDMHDDEGWILNYPEVRAHAENFERFHYDSSKLGSRYGYTPDEALRFQIEEYARDHFGWSDPREGVPELQ